MDLPPGELATQHQAVPQAVDSADVLLSKETQCSVEEPTSLEQQHQLVSTLHVKQLMAEKLSLEGNCTEEGVLQFSLAHKLLVTELERLQNGCRPFTGANKLGVEERRFADIIKDKPIKVTIRVLVPAKEHPKFNFVGKLLGPKGNSLKRLQEDTMTKMAILGRGSMRDKHKEEELRTSGDPKFSHLNDDLHVEVTAFAPPAEAHARIAYALAEVRRFLVPDYNDDIRQGQMREMQLLNTSPLTSSSSCDVMDNNTSSSHISPSTSPAPSLMTTSVKQQQQQQPQQQSNGGRTLNYTTAQAQNGSRGGGACFLYNQQLLLHPAFRGMTPRGHDLQQLQGATVYRGHNILNRLRPPLHLQATPHINTNTTTTNNNNNGCSRVLSPTSLKQHHRNNLLGHHGNNHLLNHHGNSILSILAGGPRGGNMFDPLLADSAGTMAGEGGGMLLCDGGALGSGGGGDDDVVNAAGMFAGFDNYAAAANGNGYALMDGFGNAASLMAGDVMEELSLGQEALNTGMTLEMPGSRGGGVEAATAGSVKIDRARYRHDPYGRFTGIKLPL